MRARSASSNAVRRRLLGGLTAVGFALFSAGCDRKLPGIPTPPANSAARRADPTPLAPAKAPPVPKTAIGATFGRVVVLEGVTIDHDAVKSGDYVRIWLHWQSVAAAPEDWRSIGRLVTTTRRVIASEDDQVGGRRRYLTRWQVGERVVDEMRLRVMANCPPGEYGLIVGVLRPDNQTAVAITTRPTTPNFGQEDTVLVGTIEVQSA